MSARTWSWIAPTLFAALSVLEAGCTQVVCGEGTVERSGVCYPADDQPGTATCGLGTELGAGGTCVPSDPTQCDPATTREELDPDTGITTCVGVSTDVCAAELQCPSPSAQHLTLCGRIYDTETDELIKAANPTGAPCTATTADGPCALKVAFYDALLFQMDPTGTAPLVPGSPLIVDDCGRFVVRELHTTSFGFIGAAVDDASGNPDTHVLTGAATADALAAPARGFRLYATRKATEVAWSAAANLTGANTFANQGVLAMVFRHAGLPVAGVTVQQNGNVIPNDDYYFSDAGKTRATIDPPRSTTGPNGTALVIRSSSPVPHTGTGSEPAGCRWPTALAATIPGVVFVQLKDAELVGGGGPCP